MSNSVRDRGISFFKNYINFIINTKKRLEEALVSELKSLGVSEVDGFSVEDVALCLLMNEYLTVDHPKNRAESNSLLQHFPCISTNNKKYYNSNGLLNRDLIFNDFVDFSSIREKDKQKIKETVKPKKKVNFAERHLEFSSADRRDPKKDIVPKKGVLKKSNPHIENIKEIMSIYTECMRATDSLLDFSLLSYLVTKDKDFVDYLSRVGIEVFQDVSTLNSGSIIFKNSFAKENALLEEISKKNNYSDKSKKLRIDCKEVCILDAKGIIPAIRRVRVSGYLFYILFSIILLFALILRAVYRLIKQVLLYISNGIRAASVRFLSDSEEYYSKVSELLESAGYPGVLAEHLQSIMNRVRGYGDITPYKFENELDSYNRVEISSNMMRSLMAKHMGENLFAKGGIIEKSRDTKIYKHLSQKILDKYNDCDSRDLEFWLDNLVIFIPCFIQILKLKSEEGKGGGNSIKLLGCDVNKREFFQEVDKNILNKKVEKSNQGVITNSKKDSNVHTSNMGVSQKYLTIYKVIFDELYELSRSEGEDCAVDAEKILDDIGYLVGNRYNVRDIASLKDGKEKAFGEIKNDSRSTMGLLESMYSPVKVRSKEGKRRACGNSIVATRNQSQLINMKSDICSDRDSFLKVVTDENLRRTNSNEYFVDDNGVLHVSHPGKKSMFGGYIESPITQIDECDGYSYDDMQSFSASVDSDRRESNSAEGQTTVI